MKRMKMILMLSVALAVLSGCANINVHTGTLLDIGDTQFKTDKVPCATAGIEERDYSKAEEFVIVLPEYLLKEWRMFRLSWDILAIDDNEHAHIGTLITELKEKTQDGQFYAYGKVFAFGRKAKIIILSTRSNLGFNALGNNGFFVDRSRLSDKQYLKELALKGTLLSELPGVKVFDQIISRWKYVYNTPFGRIRTPYSEKIFVPLCKINTGYTKDEADVRDLMGNYNPVNPIKTLYSIGNDIKVKLNTNPETSGWDFSSTDPDAKFTQEIIQAKRESAVTKKY